MLLVKQVSMKTTFDIMTQKEGINLKIRKWIALSLCFLAIFFVSVPVQAMDKDDINITSYVNDYANILNSQQANEINQKGEQLDQETGAQVVFVIVDSLNGDDYFDTCDELFKKYQIGSKDKDSGLLFLIGIQDREYFMMTGYGLEGILPDIKTNHMMDEYLVPYLKQGDYAKGIEELYDQVVDVIIANKDEVGTAPKKEVSFSGSPMLWAASGFVLIAIVAVLFFGKDKNAYDKEKSIILSVGEYYQLKLKGYDLEKGGIIFSTSNPKVVTCTPGGNLHALQQGTATISVMVPDKETKRIHVEVRRSGYSNRQNDDVMDAWLLYNMFRPRGGHYRSGPRGGGNSDGFGGFGGGFGSGGFGGGGFHGGGGSSGGGGSGGKW